MKARVLATVVALVFAGIASAQIRTGTWRTGAGPLTNLSGAGAVIFTAAGTVQMIDNTSKAVCWEDLTNGRDLLCYTTTDGGEKVVITGTAAALGFHVDSGTSTFDEAVTMTGGFTSNAASTIDVTDAVNYALTIDNDGAGEGLWVTQGTSLFDEAITLLSAMTWGDGDTSLAEQADDELTVTLAGNAISGWDDAASTKASFGVGTSTPFDSVNGSANLATHGGIHIRNVGSSSGKAAYLLVESDTASSNYLVNTGNASGARAFSQALGGDSYLLQEVSDDLTTAQTVYEYDLVDNEHRWSVGGSQVAEFNQYGLGIRSGAAIAGYAIHAKDTGTSVTFPWIVSEGTNALSGGGFQALSDNALMRVAAYGSTIVGTLFGQDIAGDSVVGPTGVSSGDLHIGAQVGNVTINPANAQVAEFNQYGLGVGTGAADATYDVDIGSAGQTIIRSITSDSSTSAAIQVENDNSNLGVFKAWGSAAAGTRFGLSRAGLVSFNTTSTTPFALGTVGAADLTLGTNDIAALTINGTNQNVSVAGSVTLSTVGDGYLLGDGDTGWDESSDDVMVATTGGAVALSMSASQVSTFSRTSATTNAAVEVVNIDATSSGTEADGFGGALSYYMDGTSVAYINAARDGADNSASLEFATANAGSFTKAMTINSSQDVGIGVDPQSVKITVGEVGSNSVIRNMAYGTSNFGIVQNGKARGTEASPTAVQSGDTVGKFQFFGQYDTTPGNVGSAGAIVATASENFTTIARGTALSLYTIPIGSTTETLAVTVGTNQQVSFTDAVFPEAVTADPCAATGYAVGALFYNSTSNYFCYCDGTNDVRMHDPATACF